jgi:ankyrin repeat protein
MDVNYSKMNDAFTKEIIERIVETADGMLVTKASGYQDDANVLFFRFLLPALQIQTVLDQTSIAGRRNALNSMPTKLDNAFQVIIDRIQRQAPVKSHQGMEVLKWTYLNERQLTIDELRHALAAVDCTAEDLEDSLPFENTLTDCCYGLVVIDKETSSVSLVHKSLQEFLKIQHEGNNLFLTGHGEIARTCLHYMNFDDSTLVSNLSRNRNKELAYGKFPPLHQRSLSITKYPFLNYAIHFWGDHARRQIDSQGTRLISDLLLNKESRHCISRCLRLSALDGSAAWRQKVLTTGNAAKFPGLHLLAHFGIDSMLHILLDNVDGLDINERLCGKTPLHIASERGHAEFVRRLLERHDIDVDLEDNDGRTSLLLAVEGGHDDVVRLLLEKGADISCRTRDNRAPLHVAANFTQIGHNTTLRLLLENGADVNLQDKKGNTPLLLATQRFNVNAVILLLESGASSSLSDSLGRTPLSWAASTSSSSTSPIINLLLEYGADVNLPCNYKRTPFSWACSQYQSMGEEVLSLLLDQGADINQPDKDNATPLITAVRSRREGLVDFLLKKGADPNIADKDGRTPLVWAAAVGDQDNIRLLIENGADFRSNKEGGTPLSSASTQAQLPTIDLLIDKGADPNETWGDQRRTPLISAVIAGATKAVDRLLERGAGIDVTDGEGRTPLCWVITTGENLHMLNYLIEKGADVNARDKEGRTILERLQIEKVRKNRTPGELRFLEVAEGVLKERGGMISEPHVSPLVEPVPYYA